MWSVFIDKNVDTWKRFLKLVLEFTVNNWHKGLYNPDFIIINNIFDHIYLQIQITTTKNLGRRKAI